MQTLAISVENTFFTHEESHHMYIQIQSSHAPVLKVFVIIIILENKGFTKSNQTCYTALIL